MLISRCRRNGGVDFYFSYAECAESRISGQKDVKGKSTESPRKRVNFFKDRSFFVGGGGESQANFWLGGDQLQIYNGNGNRKTLVVISVRFEGSNWALGHRSISENLRWTIFVSLAFLLTNCKKSVKKVFRRLWCLKIIKLPFSRKLPSFQNYVRFSRKQMGNLSILCLHVLVVHQWLW